MRGGVGKDLVARALQQHDAHVCGRELSKPGEFSDVWYWQQALSSLLATLRAAFGVREHVLTVEEHKARRGILGVCCEAGEHRRV